MEKDQAQCIVCKCGSVVAACREPECYQEASWMKDVRTYSSKGYRIEMRGLSDFRLNYCVCKKVVGPELFPI